jgi:hypothetical protein
MTMGSLKKTGNGEGEKRMMSVGKRYVKRAEHALRKRERGNEDEKLKDEKDMARSHGLVTGL